MYDSIASSARHGRAASADDAAVVARRGGPKVADRAALLALVAGLALARLALGLAYGVVVPPWEAHDETGHYAYVHYVAAQRALPPVGGELTPWFDEAHQPPLYYLLAGLAGSVVAPEEPPRPTMNPFFLRGDLEGGVNAVVHDPSVEAFPYRGHVLLLHLARVVSALLGAATVVVIYLVGREALPGRPELAVAGAALAGFTPTAVFVGSAVSNDALVPLTGGLVLLAGLKVARGTGGRRWAAALGCFLGLALLSKNSALAFAPFAFAALAIGLRRGVAGVEGLLRVGLAASATLATAGWWYLRNQLVYGRPLVDREPTNPIISTLSPFVESLGKAVPGSFAATLVESTFRSYWALFGWGNLVAPDGFYLAAAALTALGLIGLILGVRNLWRDHAARLGVGLLALFAFLGLALPLYRAIYFNTPTLVPGRYLLSAAAAIGPLLALGVATALPGAVRSAGLGAVSLGLVACSAAALPVVIAPAYAPPPLLTEEQVRGRAEPVYFDFGHRLALVGYAAGQRSVRPGEPVEVTLYWKALDRMAENYTIGVHVVDAELRSLGQIDRFPGRGNFATSLWQPGDLFAETYRVPVAASAQPPALLRFVVGVQRFEPESPDSARYLSRGGLPAFDGAGQGVTPVFGTLKLRGSSEPPAGLESVHYSLGEAIELIGYRLSSRSLAPGERLQVDLLWRVSGPVAERYVVFAHLLDPGGRVAAQHDAEPRGGGYPTYLWEPGELVPDRYELSLDASAPPGEYLLEVGMYRREDLVRLAVRDAAGRPVAHDRVLLGTVRVGQ